MKSTDDKRIRFGYLAMLHSNNGTVNPIVIFIEYFIFGDIYYKIRIDRSKKSEMDPDIAPQLAVMGGDTVRHRTGTSNGGRVRANRLKIRFKTPHPQACGCPTLSRVAAIRTLVPPQNLVPV